MNNDLLLKSLSDFRKWIKQNPVEANLDQTSRKDLISNAQKYTKEKILNMSSDDIYDYLSPLWAMMMWGNKHYKIDKIIEDNGLDKLRKYLANLMYGSESIDKRWDEFRSSINGIGPAIMSELLCKTFPNDYILWNTKTINGFKYLQINELPRYDSTLDGKKYLYLSQIGKNILKFAHSKGFNEVNDMLNLDFFIWQELQKDTNLNNSKEQEIDIKSKKESMFVHNDIRDQIRDIGQFLGFDADIEKKVAAGAVVDAIWNVKIGNMGRIIYVFEVQTAGSIDSLILNLIKAKNNKAVQGIVAVTDAKQIETIKKEVQTVPTIRDEIKYWDYTEVLQVYDNLSSVNESINKLQLLPDNLQNTIIS